MPKYDGAVATIYVKNVPVGNQSTVRVMVTAWHACKIRVWENGAYFGHGGMVLKFITLL